MMFKDRETIPIKEVCKGIYDGPHATPKPADAGPIFLGIKNIREDGMLDLSNIRHISEEDYPKWIKRVKPAFGDIVFSYEATLNRYAIIPKGFRGCLGRRMALIRPNNSKINTRYLYYYFFSNEWRNVVFQNTLIGSTVDRIPLTQFPDFPIIIPPLNEQIKIAAILSAYDNLIENNLRRIKILEEMAQNLYREWFVNFRFPGYEQTRFVDSPLGRIPEGWEVVKLGELIKIRKGKNITKKTIVKGTIPVIAGGKSPAYYHNSPNTMPPVITISASGANAGYVCLYHEAIWASDCSVIDMDVTKYIYYYYLQLSERHVEVTNLQRGSAQPHVYSKDLMELEALNVPFSVLNCFNDEIKPIYNMIRILSLKSKTLRQTRDLLLPKLISGEVDVSELDIKVPEEVAS